MDKKRNTHAVFKNLGASNHTKRDRQEDDFYATPTIAIKCLLNKIAFDKNITVLEPCCGKGHISKTLIENGYNVISRDLIDYGYGEFNRNFLTDEYNINNNFNIITNPPFKYAVEFIQKSMDIIANGCYCAMLLKIQFLEVKNVIVYLINIHLNLYTFLVIE